MITLKPIKTWEEYEAIVKLEVREEQKKFIESNLQSFADAFVWTETTGSKTLVLGIYNGDIPVGFTMFCYNTVKEHGVAELNESLYYLWRFMIDKNQQDKGYGKAALTQVIELIKAEKPLGQANWLYTSVQPENHAYQLYKNAGFVETGDGNGIKNDMRMSV